MKKNTIETAKFAISDETLSRIDVYVRVNFQGQLCIQREREASDDMIGGMFLLSKRLKHVEKFINQTKSKAFKGIEFKIIIGSYTNDILAFLPVIATMIPLNAAAEELKKVAVKVAEIETEIIGEDEYSDED